MKDGWIVLDFCLLNYTAMSFTNLGADIGCKRNLKKYKNKHLRQQECRAIFKIKHELYFDNTKIRKKKVKWKYKRV